MNAGRCQGTRHAHQHAHAARDRSFVQRFADRCIIGNRQQPLCSENRDNYTSCGFAWRHAVIIVIVITIIKMIVIVIVIVIVIIIILIMIMQAPLCAHACVACSDWASAVTSSQQLRWPVIGINYSIVEDFAHDNKTVSRCPTAIGMTRCLMLRVWTQLIISSMTACF